MHDEVEVGIRDAFAAHGEELVRSRYGHEVRTRCSTWPRTGVSHENFRDQEVIVAWADDVVAGRAILDAVYYPFAELENLEVLPAFRGRGLASRIVSDAVTRAARMGFLAVHIQPELDNVAAHRLYARHGFLPATQGEMLRLVRFLNFGALSQFLYDHPLAEFASGAVDGPAPSRWELSWSNPIDEERLAIELLGGSCQADSDGFGPAVSAVALKSGEVDVRAAILGPRAVARNQPFDLEVKIANPGSALVSGSCRLVLNPGFQPPKGMSGGASFRVDANETASVRLPVVVLDTFDSKVLPVCSYRSVSTVVEVFIGDQVLWLSCQHKVE